jgi:hypothetical protein
MTKINLPDLPTVVLRKIFRLSSFTQCQKYRLVCKKLSAIFDLMYKDNYFMMDDEIHNRLGLDHEKMDKLFDYYSLTQLNHVALLNWNEYDTIKNDPKKMDNYLSLLCKKVQRIKTLWLKTTVSTTYFPNDILINLARQSIPFITEINFENCIGLNDESLDYILDFTLELRTLILINCASLNGRFLRGYFTAEKMRKLVIHNCSNINNGYFSDERVRRKMYLLDYLSLRGSEICPYFFLAMTQLDLVLRVVQLTHLDFTILEKYHKKPVHFKSNQLHKLEFSECKAEQDYGFFNRTLCNNSSLTYFDVSRTRAENPTTGRMFYEMETPVCAPIEEFYLTDTDLNDEDLRFLHCLSPTLTKLSLKQCKNLTDQSIRDALHAFSKLDFIDLSYTNVSRETIQSVFDLFSEQPDHRECLVIVCEDHKVDFASFHQENNFKWDSIEAKPRTNDTIWYKYKNMIIETKGEAPKLDLNMNMNDLSLSENVTRLTIDDRLTLDFTSQETLNLTSLDLSLSNIDNSDVSLILRRLENLKHLNLSNCDLLDEKLVFTNEKCVAKLESLDLSNTSINTQVAKSLIDSFSESLKVLNVNSCHCLSGKSMIYFFNCLKQIQILNASNCSNVDSHFFVVNENKTLIDLDLSGNNFISDRKLVKMCEQMISLKTLRVRGCEMLTSQSFSECILKCSSLECLDISDTSANNLVADAAVVAALQLNRKLPLHLICHRTQIVYEDFVFLIEIQANEDVRKSSMFELVNKGARFKYKNLIVDL